MTRRQRGTAASRRRKSGPLHHPIRAASRLTGVSTDTLRAWERRYGAVTPRRAGRGRVYTEDDIARLRLLRELVARGHAIGSIATTSDEGLRALLESGQVSSEAPGHAAAVGLDAAVAALDRYDAATLEMVLSRHAAVLPPPEFVFAVIVPLLREIGSRWASGALRPAQEHLVSAAVRNVMGGQLRGLARPDALPKIVFATPVHERHELGLLCAAVLAASAGYGVIYLGPDLPAVDIAHAARTTRARVIMVGLTTPGAVPDAEIEGLADPPVGVELWVGGPDAARLLAVAGDRGRQVPGLASVVPLLRNHVR